MHPRCHSSPLTASHNWVIARALPDTTRPPAPLGSSTIWPAAYTRATPSPPASNGAALRVTSIAAQTREVLSISLAQPLLSAVLRRAEALPPTSSLERPP